MEKILRYDILDDIEEIAPDVKDEEEVTSPPSDDASQWTHMFEFEPVDTVYKDAEYDKGQLAAISEIITHLCATSRGIRNISDITVTDKGNVRFSAVCEFSCVRNIMRFLESLYRSIVRGSGMYLEIVRSDGNEWLTQRSGENDTFDNIIIDLEYVNDFVRTPDNKYVSDFSGPLKTVLIDIVRKCSMIFLNDWDRVWNGLERSFGKKFNDSVMCMFTELLRRKMPQKRVISGAMEWPVSKKLSGGMVTLLDFIENVGNKERFYVSSMPVPVTGAEGIIYEYEVNNRHIMDEFMSRVIPADNFRFIINREMGRIGFFMLLGITHELSPNMVAVCTQRLVIKTDEPHNKFNIQQATELMEDVSSMFSGCLNRNDIKSAAKKLAEIVAES